MKVKTNKKAPCYMCERRWVTSKDSCHSSCEEYKAFAQERADRAEKIRKQKADEAMVTQVFINSIKRCTKDANVNVNKQNAWKG